MYKLLLRPLLFIFPPETIHCTAELVLRLSGYVPLKHSVWRWLFCIRHPGLHRKLMGIHFPNPVGLAAGFDKNGVMTDALASLGFGFVEVGTVTPMPQEGNPKPRMFRLAADEALINRMGFNNDGVNKIAARLRKRKPGIIIGGNIGKNKITPNTAALRDYEHCFEKLFDCVDYFVVNVSSPNTPGLRALQEKEPLMKILNRLQELNRRKIKRKPILLKIAPDLTNGQLDDIIQIVKETKTDGVIATNTTISREGLKTLKATVDALGPGGLSGKPLAKRATEVIRYLSDKSGKSFAIIGVGGIHSPEDALEKLQAGADLIQLYTGFIYEGPGLIRSINRRLRDISQ